jgi:NOL1/NOP2/fmu family ribosome biogenesis protein
VLRSGTSLAAPFVTALLAAETAAVGLSPDEAVSWLEGEAIDLGAPGRDDVYGWGLAKLNGVCAAE